jgi:hypothetical protein
MTSRKPWSQLTQEEKDAISERDFPRRLFLKPIDGRARHHPLVEVLDGSVRYKPAKDHPA